MKVVCGFSHRPCGSLRRPRSDSPLPYSIDLEPPREPLTAYGGLPQVAEAFRALGGAAAVELVEGFVWLLAAGGECLDDFARLGADQGLVALVGHALLSPETARRFLYRFHDEAQAGPIALPPEELDARPKRLRFRLFALAGRVVRCGRAIALRLA